MPTAHLSVGHTDVIESQLRPTIARDQLNGDDGLLAFGALRHPGELDQPRLFESQVPAVMRPGAPLVLHREVEQAVDLRADDLPARAEPALHPFWVQPGAENVFRGRANQSRDIYFQRVHGRSFLFWVSRYSSRRSR